MARLTKFMFAGLFYGSKKNKKSNRPFPQFFQFPGMAYLDYTVLGAIWCHLAVVYTCNCIRKAAAYDIHSSNNIEREREGGGEDGGRERRHPQNRTKSKSKQDKVN